MPRQHQATDTNGSLRLVRPIAVVVSMVLLAAACGSEGDDATADGSSEDDLAAALGDNVLTGPQEEDSEPVQGGSLTIGIESETNSFLPSAFQGSQAGINIAYTIYDPLFTRSSEGEPAPYLAESIEPNDDFTEWTMTLRPDVQFHDGTPLNAEAIKITFDEYVSAEGANTRGIVRDVENLEVVDDLTVRYQLSQPNAAFPDILTTPVGWAFSPTAARSMGDAFGSQPVGTGPFQFVSWQRDGSFVVERNEDYWQEDLPHLDEITFRPIPDEETRATSLTSGDIDAVQSVRLSSFLTRVLEGAGVEAVLGLGNGAGNIMFNTTEPPVDDVRIRQALAFALDQQALIEVVADEAAVATEPRSQFFPSDSPYYSDEVADAWPSHDAEQAQELYDEYVNDPDRSDGKAPGEPVSLTYDCTNVPSLIEQATAIQGLWEEIGFEVTVNPLEQSVHINGAVTGDYQVKCFRAGVDQDPLTVLQNAFGDPEVFVTNLTDFTHPTIEEGLQTLRTTDDLEERVAAVEEIGLVLAEELPYYWTGSDITFIAANEGVHGVESWVLPDGPLGDGAAPGITFWSQVWLED